MFIISCILGSKNQSELWRNRSGRSCTHFRLCEYSFAFIQLPFAISGHFNSAAGTTFGCLKRHTNFTAASGVLPRQCLVTAACNIPTHWLTTGLQPVQRIWQGLGIVCYQRLSLLYSNERLLLLWIYNSERSAHNNQDTTSGKKKASN